MKLLLVEDKAGMRDMLTRALSREGYQVAAHADAEAAITALANLRFDLVLTDLKLPGQDGLAVLKAAKAAHPDLPVVLMTAHGSIEGAVQAMREGAADFITKPFDPDHLALVLSKASRTSRVMAENRVLRQTARHLAPPHIIGASPALREALERVERVAPGATSVLLTGESGTGKELFARLVHNRSPRRAAPFVAVNCAAIPTHLLESEFFGHEKGAFTGADQRRLGKFELAHGGTIFLDEIGDMDLTLQAKLLRVLQDGQVNRVGGEGGFSVDVRVVAATNQRLEEHIAHGRFREDLFYRLSAFPIRVPPLRERPGDIPALADHFVRRYAAELNRPVTGIAPAALAELTAYPWPGNIRELQNCVERAVILATDDTIRRVDFGVPAHPAAPEAGEPGIALDRPLHEVAADAQRRYESACIRRAMDLAGGNRTRAAEILQVSYKTLLTKLREYAIEPVNAEP
ncbi:MAG: sigma-54-dependent Fis family transcriptional regulator [Nitrospirae bacterium]|nr:sigma-54-dependent Fis family transcriptional regulator [Nitrospirota bacterium]